MMIWFETVELWEAMEKPFTKRTTHIAQMKKEDKEFIVINGKSMDVMHCALNADEFNQVPTC